MVFVLDGAWVTSESKFLWGLRSRRKRLVESVIAILNCLNAYNTTNFARGYTIITLTRRPKSQSYPQTPRDSPWICSQRASSSNYPWHGWRAKSSTCWNPTRLSWTRFPSFASTIATSLCLTSSRNSSSTTWLSSSCIRSLSFGSSWDGPGFSSASICAFILECSWCAPNGIEANFCVIAFPKDQCFASLPNLTRLVGSKWCPWVASSRCCKVAPALSISSSIIQRCPHCVTRICRGSFIISASTARFFNSNRTVIVHFELVIVSPFPNFY